MIPFTLSHVLQKAEEDPVGVKVTVRELEDVLIRDVGNKISEDGRFFSSI